MSGSGGDRLGTVRAAVVQAVPVFLDRTRSVDRVCELVHQAGEQGAELVVFPEGFVPTHPIWFHFHAATSRTGLDLAAELFRNAVVVDGPEVERVAEAARQAGCWVVLGVCEKRARTTGTMWNSILYVSPTDGLVHVRRKLTPTVGERLVHTGGDGAGLQAVDAPFGPVSGLLCAENSNPLLVFSVAAQYAVVHTALWPNHFSPTQPRMREVILTSARAIAYQAGCFVLNAASTLDDVTLQRVANTDEDRAWLGDPANLGGSCIVAPDGSLLAGQAGAEETILVADLDLDSLVGKQVIHDFAGHYNRADVLQLRVAAGHQPAFVAPWADSADTSEEEPVTDDLPAPSLEGL